MQLYWYVRSLFFEIKEQKWVRRHLYLEARFQELDQALLNAYQRESPYVISKDFLLNRAAPNPHLYGETPLSTASKIAAHFGVTQKDCLIDLGAGRCRLALFFAEIVGCRVIAIEQIPRFVQIARAIRCPRLTVLQGDYFQIDLAAATVVYLYGSHLNEEETNQIISLFQQLSSNVKILTVSAPLPGFEVVDQMEARFPWGKTEIYWNKKWTNHQRSATLAQ